MAAGPVRVVRVYDPPTAADGRRVLVDRLWPRGLSKQRAALDLWCRDIAPSTELREWYGHDRQLFEEFGQRYRAELTDPVRAAALVELVEHARQQTLTLLTAVKMIDISHASFLARLIADRVQS